MDNTASCMIEVCDLHKHYKDVHVLRGISTTVAKGEVCAVIGPSGSGKSTTMNIIGALDSPTSGEYLFQGLHVERLTNDERALLRRRFMGFVFQGFNLLARTTALENVELPLLYRGVPTAERHELARAALDRVGLLQWEDHTPAELSGGQQQRVAIARAIVTKPLLLMADEPTGSLDSRKSVEIMELLTDLNKSDKITIVLVTHEPDMAAYARRCVHCIDGMIASDTPQEGK